MANNFQSVTSGLAELKNFYEGPIVSQFNDDLPLYRGAEKGKHQWSGQQIIRPIKVRRNTSIGATSDGGSLPSIGRQTTVQSIILAKYNYLRFGITGPMIKASQSNIGSFVRSAAYELEEGYKDLMSDTNRQLSWSGTGKLAVVNTAAIASTTVVVAGRETNDPAQRFVEVGMTLDLIDGVALTVKQAAVTITAVSGKPTDLTVTLTFDQAVTASATNSDYFIRSGSLNNEIQGILTQLDGGTTVVFNVDRSLYPSFQGNVIDLGAGQLTLDKMQQGWNEGMRRGGAKYSAIYCDYTSLRMYQKLLTADKRYTNTVQGDGTFADHDRFFMEFGGIPIVPDKDCPQRFFFLPEEAIKKYVLAELEFADETGSMYIAQVGSDQLEVRIRLFANLFNEKPSACAVIQNYISP